MEEVILVWIFSYLFKDLFLFSADTPFSQVKVGEVTSWLARRDKSPKALVGAFSRAWWRWNHKYVQPKRSGVAPFFQVVTASMIFFYAINYGKLSKFLGGEEDFCLIRKMIFNSILFPPPLF